MFLLVYGRINNDQPPVQLVARSIFKDVHVERESAHNKIGNIY